MDSDIELDERLIAQLLREDLVYIEDESAAESLQLLQALADSLVISGNTTFDIQDLEREVSAQPLAPEKDQAMALRLYANDMTANEDELFARSLQADDATIVTNHQAALKLAAEERKMQLDMEYARRLQQMIDDDRFDDHSETLKSVEGVMKIDDIDEILAQDHNSKGKGRRVQSEDEDDITSPKVDVVRASVAPVVSSSYNQCGICQEPFVKTSNPLKASKTPTSSSRLSFGLCLECPGRHMYCLDCMTNYLRGKLEEGGGHGDRLVFPVRCPECPVEVWQMEDHVAEKILGEDLLEMWYFQKIIDSLPRRYCPNRKCSIRLEVEEDLDVPEAECPSCHTLMCVPCRSIWHSGLTCEEFQDLPEDERAPEDRAVLELAKSERWRRCPNCQAIIELSHGCNHMTCVCKHEFCHRCGADWKGKCTRQPSCELWDEEMLYEERERLRLVADHSRRRVGAYPQPPLPNAELLRNVVAQAPAVMAQGEMRARNNTAHSVNQNGGWATGVLDWMSDPNIVSARHWFTSDMIRTLTCGYCLVRLNSLQDLRYHLTHTRRHAVYACCGKFFKRELDFQRHQASNVYSHDYQMVREDVDGF